MSTCQTKYNNSLLCRLDLPNSFRFFLAYRSNSAEYPLWGKSTVRISPSRFAIHRDCIKLVISC
ncbi:hypothetical protein SERLA73DRAFT_176646 [Serpula lacrymans var. lacrymans S7.3]|uniref:Uncharacterized protein n=2 Tax=Serpula lacrymans var. lacrymans TaxID=341189 RepID=F8PNE3_SERL3|nr:uncharacterized protein SERLADRAFT_459771 [Serpula lacrymans var. lacrymans S7.9]EGO03125.1 hypothetical protein SERLA73DRAFT_176646 [Serpula lacrymans var. lacrymans S7.3]EGO28894.1 hypothetical protein SERLADRAFT_459771 [Serpula lacrymans var. lacrymans S7.9]